MAFLPSLALGAAGDIASGLIGKAFGGGTSVAKQSALQTELMAYQNKYAKDFDSGVVQRRVADAKLAGVSPMAALGMTPSGGSSVVGGNFDFQSANGDTSMGQNVGRAMAAAADPMQRLQMRLLNSQIEGQDIDNEYKRSQLSRNTAQIGPAMPGITTDPTPGSAYQKFTLQDGRSFTGPGAELGQMMENSPAHGAAVYLRDVIHGLKNIFKSGSGAIKAGGKTLFSIRKAGDY